MPPVRPHTVVRRSRALAVLVGGIVVAVGVVAAVALLEGGQAGPLAVAGRLLAAVPANLPLLLAVVLLAPVAVAVAARPQIGVLLLVLLVPYDDLVGITIGYPRFAEAWKEVLLGYVVVWAVLSAVGRPRPTYPLLRGIAQPIALYVAIGVLSAMQLLPGVGAFVGVKIAFYFLLAFVAVVFAPLSARERDWLVSILMLDGLVNALLSLWQQQAGPERMISLGYEYDTHIRFTGDFMRSVGSFNQPFGLGYFLAVVLLIGLSVSLADLGRARNVAFLVCTPVLAAGLAFSFVRGAWLALAVGLVYLAFRRYHALLLGAPFVLLGLLVLPGSFGTPAFATGSFNERRIGWLENLDKIGQGPLGAGTGTTGSAAEKIVQVTTHGPSVYYQPDNQYFKVLYEMGVLGLWFFLLVLVAAVLVVRAAERRLEDPDRALAIGTTAHLLGIAAACFVATYFEIFPMDMLTWILLAVVVTSVRVDVPEPAVAPASS